MIPDSIIYYGKDNDLQPTYVGCLILTSDRKILLQKRGVNFHTYPDFLCEFGGRVEGNEIPKDAIIRELHEELGAVISTLDIQELGLISEEITAHKQYIQMYFWHDKNNTITGCYEGEAKNFDSIDEIMKSSKLMDSVRWLIIKCLELKLI